MVKGQWAGEPDLPLHSGFLAVVDRLAGRVPAVGVATHDWRLASEAITRLRNAGTPCELELLYGLPLVRAAAVARRLETPVRIYVPYGRGWLPYALSRAFSSPRTVARLARDLVRRRGSEIDRALR